MEIIRNYLGSFVHRVKNLSLKVKIGVYILLLITGWFAKPLVLGTSEQTPQYQTATVMHKEYLSLGLVPS